MKLSIIVPVYNMAGEGKLAYCLESLLHQTISDYEIIAVNDASTDASLAILEEYQEKNPDKLFLYSLPENRRQGGAKNVGLSKARGEFIGFVDSDDWVTPDMYEKLIFRAEESGADVVGCDFCYISEHSMQPTTRVPCNQREQTGELDHDKKASLFLNPGALVTKIYRRELFFREAFSFPEKMFFEDNATGVELLRRATHFEYVEEPLYFYYQHDGSTVHVVTRQRCEDRLQAMRIMYRYAMENGYLEEFHTELEYIFTTLFYQNTLFSYMQGKQKKDLSFVRSMGREIKKTFPHFSENPIYRRKVPESEKKLMQLQQKSTFLFAVYYRLLRIVWARKK